MSTRDDGDSTWENEMGDAFERRVRGLHEAPFDLGAVKGRATRIRRRRRAAVAGGVLAAAAAVVPVALLVGAGTGDRAGLEPAGPSVTVTDPSDPEALGTGYLERRTYHRADGTTVDLPGTYRSATAVGTDVYATRSDEETGDLVVDAVGADGGIVDTFGVLAAPVSDRAQDLVAFVDLDGALVVRWPGGANLLATDLSEGSVILAVAGGPTCEPGSECRVYLDDESVADGKRVVTADREVEALPADVLAVRDVSEGGIAAVLESVPGDQESCGGLYDLDAESYVVESCDHSFLGVSPDGELADTTHPYLDGFGNGWAAIVDRDGTELARYTPAGGVVTDQAWQDDEHLLVVAHLYDSREWVVVRLGVDGSEQVVAGPIRAPMEAYPYRLG